MNDSGARRRQRGRDFGAHRPAARDAHDLDDPRLLSFGMFFELYDLLFSGLCRAEPRQVGLADATTPGLFGTAGVASFIAALFTGLFIGTILCGFLADRFGRRAIFTWSLIWYSAANVMVALQNDASGLNFWRLISGIGLGVEMVTIGAYLSEMAPKGMRGRAFAVNQAIGFVCVPVISFLAYMLVPTAPLGLEGWRWVVLIGALAAPVVGLPAARPAGKPALARQAGAARRGRPGLARASRRRSRRNTAGRCPRPAPRSRFRQRAAFGISGFPASAAASS